MRRTGMFYIWVQHPDEFFNPMKKRLFIGTATEAEEEFKEEIKTLYPDDYDRITDRMWAEKRMELLLSVMHRTQVVVRDPIKGVQVIRMEFTGGWKDEN